MTYPSSLDELTDGVPSDGAAPTTALDNATYPHDDHHRALGVAVEAIEAELGTNPKGGSADVKSRIAATETVANAAAAKASNLSDLTSASSARTNLGLGGAATLSVGTTAGTVAAGDDSRITGAVPKSTVTTAGDLIYGTGNAAVSRLGIGSALQVLRTNAGATAPEWADASGLDAPWHQTIDVRAVPYAQTNMSTLTLVGGTVYYSYARIDSGTAGAASVSYKFPMSAGTYSIEIVAYADTYMPIVTAKIDGTTVGTVDFYKTGGIVQREGAITGISVSTSGTKVVNLTNATKNASSSGYTFYLMALRILRTA